MLTNLSILILKKRKYFFILFVIFFFLFFFLIFKSSIVVESPTIIESMGVIEPTTSNVVVSSKKSFSNQVYPDTPYFSFSMERQKLETKRVFMEMGKVPVLYNFKELGEFFK